MIGIASPPLIASGSIRAGFRMPAHAWRRRSAPGGVLADSCGSATPRRLRPCMARSGARQPHTRILKPALWIAHAYAAEPMRLEGRKALVTGGASGIGAAIAARLAAEGAEVVIGDLNADGARSAADEIGARAVELDVTVPEASVRVTGEHGPFAILVNNAGTDQFGFFTDTDPDVWERLLAVNLVGVFACTHAVLPGMQQAGYGRIVNIASEAGRVGSKGSAVYSAAKGGVIAFTKTIARENARYGVTANSIAPGPIETPLLMQALELGELGNKIVETMKAGTQMRRLGEPDEVAAVVSFQNLPEGSATVGFEICVKHVAPAAEGSRCTVRATLREVVDGRKLRF